MSSSSTTGVVVSTALAMAIIGGGVGFGLHTLQNQDLSEAQVHEIGTQLKSTNFWDILFQDSSTKSLNSLDGSDDLIIIPATRAGDHLLVTVELNDFREVTLLVDTGATDIALSSEIAFDLGILESESQESLTYTANGAAQTFITKLETVRIGEATQQNVQVSFLNSLGGPHMDGLLGMSFLKHYIVDVNLAREELRLHPR